MGDIRNPFVVNNYSVLYVLARLIVPYAIVTNHLRAPYGVYFTKNRTILRRPYGARPAAGRIVRFFHQVFRHRTVPGEV